jgi:hypothetical protein
MEREECHEETFHSYQTLSTIDTYAEKEQLESRSQQSDEIQSYHPMIYLTFYSNNHIVHNVQSIFTYDQLKRS